MTGEVHCDRALFNSACTASESILSGRAMIKWLIVTVLEMVVFSGLRPFLSRFGTGRLPGDFNFQAFGRGWSLPIASTILLSLFAALIARLI